MLLVTLFVTTGATCFPSRKPLGDVFTPPVIFEQAPTLEQLSEQINHSLAIQSIESNTLKVSSPDMPVRLDGHIVWERPYNFSLQAYMGSSLFGTALAAGTTQDVFWLKRQLPLSSDLYFARAEEFENQQGPRRILPVSPVWLREAMGIVEMDPRFPHRISSVRPDGKMEVETTIRSNRGKYIRKLVLDPKTAILYETTLYEVAQHDSQPRMIAHAAQSEHQYHGEFDGNLPHRVDVSLVPDGGETLAFTVEIGSYLINQSSSTTADTFAIPDATGLNQYDLVRLNGGQSEPESTPKYTPAQNSSYRHTPSGYGWQR